VEGFFQDIRYGLRQLRKSPGFALIAVLSLAIGIGATTAMFSIVYATLLHPYPFRDWERLATLTVNDASGNVRWPGLNGAQLAQLRQARSVEEVVAFRGESLTITAGDLPEDVGAVYWTTNAGKYFGVPPVLGRDLAPSDAPQGQEPLPVLMLGYNFWLRHFGGDPGVIGREIELSHRSYRIVGVQSPRLNWGGIDGVYLPLKVTSDPYVRLDVSLRLRPGVSFEAASAELAPQLQQFAKQTPANFPQLFRTNILPLSYGIKIGLGPSLRLLFGAVCLLLLIACLNVSILLMARGTRRQYELAVRAAMGAARTRIVRQLLTEALLIALAGEALGIALAYATQQLLVQQLPLYLAVRAPMIHVNLPVLAFSVAATLITVLVFGLLPAVQLSRRHLRDVIQLGTQKLAGGWGKHTRNALIAGQIALSLVLLAAAATSIRAFMGLLHADLGYDSQNTLVLAIPVHPGSYTTWETRAAYFDRLQQKVASTPQVISAAVSIGGVPPFNAFMSGIEVLGETAVGDQQVCANFVSPEYFATLRIPLQQGRVWDHAEEARGAAVALVNHTFARRYFPNGDALGRQIRMLRLNAVPPTVAAPGSDDWRQIVGVTSDAMNNGLRNPVLPAVYMPTAARMPMAANILVRTQGEPLAMLRTLREQVQAVDSEQQIMRNAFSLQDAIEQQDDWQREHLVALLFSAFSAITLLLAGIGLYSVVSYSVAQRTREFAVRMALGAQRADVLRNVAWSIGSVIAAGLLAGVGMHLAISRLVAQWASASSGELAALLLVTPLLAVVALVACYVPARRAMKLDPVEALRYE
jgi:putative ABC transport system permease protein